MKADNRVKALIVAVILIIIQFGVSAYFIFTGAYDASAVVSVSLRICGLSALGLELAFMIFSRVTKNETHLKGLFIRGFVGMCFFVISFIMKLSAVGSGEVTGTKLFDVFTVLLRPAAYLTSPLVGMTEFIGKALILGLLTVLSGVFIQGTKKQKKFEEEMKKQAIG